MIPEPDLSLIGNISDTNSAYNHPVIIAEFKRAGKALCYVAVRHVVGIENPISAAIKSAVEQFNPDAVVIESHYGHDNTGYVAYVHEQSASGFKDSREDTYAAYLATQRKIPFVGGEPSDKTIMAGMIEAGYSSRDVQAFYLLRQIPVWREEHKLSEQGFAEQATKFLGTINSIFETSNDDALNIVDFKKWYDKHNTTRKSFLEIENSDLAPINSEKASYFQILNHVMDPIRERNIITVIANNLNEYDRVLVVYGNGHLTKSRPVFKKMFGHEPSIDVP